MADLWKDVTQLVIGRAAAPAVYGGLDSSRVFGLEVGQVFITLGLIPGLCGRNTSAAFAMEDPSGDEVWFGLFVGHDADERSIFASSSAALACAELCQRRPTGVSTSEMLSQLLLTANLAVARIQSHHPPDGLALGSSFTSSVTHLKGVHASVCLGHFKAPTLNLLRLGECSILDLNRRKIVWEADLLFKHAPSRSSASCLSGLGLDETQMSSQPLEYKLQVSDSIAVCSAAIHEVIETDSGLEAFLSTLHGKAFDDLEHEIDSRSIVGSRAFLCLERRVEDHHNYR